jgi:hypothetical protein
MLNTIVLRLIYTAHMLAPLSLVLWHIERLSPSTVHALRSLFP